MPGSLQTSPVCSEPVSVLKMCEKLMTRECGDCVSMFQAHFLSEHCYEFEI